MPFKAAALQFILAYPALVPVMPGVWFVAEVMAEQIFSVVGMDDTGNVVLRKHGRRRVLMRCASCRFSSLRNRTFMPSIGMLFHAHYASLRPGTTRRHPLNGIESRLTLRVAMSRSVGVRPDR